MIGSNVAIGNPILRHRAAAGVGGDVPGQVTDITAQGYYQGQVDLQCTAPGTNGYSGGTCPSYSVRFNEVPITDANWASSFVSETDTPNGTGPGSMLYFGFGADQGYYYIAIRFKGTNGNLGPTSLNFQWNAG